MKIKKAIITAAGKGQRTIPLQTFVDRDGRQKTALQILVEEAGSAGAEDVCVVVSPGDRDAYTAAAGEHAGRLSFVEQTTPRGYGHALLSARAFAEGQPFLHLVSDHLPISTGAARCARQLVEIAEAEDCAVSAVQPTRESQLAHFGAVGGTRVPRRHDLYDIENVLEKPTPTEAEQTLIVPGLRAGYYLTFFGLHVLTPAVMDLLAEQDTATPKDGRYALSPALARLAQKEKYLALQVQGRRYDMGGKYGLLFAQLALALDGNERDEVLAQMVELLAARKH
ncbi:MAG: sugar phosphate nucleotidyltransferase [Phycisphaerae bacterium]|nr:sugar phosphate nucleotidyltransferase [Tepidisphaeraceae bacterium]